jgi:hypothetical protein
LHTLRKRRQYLDAPFLVQGYLGFKPHSSILETAGLRVRARYITEFFYMLNVFSSSKNCPSARCASTVIAACLDVEVFETKSVYLHYNL